MFYGQCWKCGERWALDTASTCKCPDETPKRPWVGLTDEEIEMIYAVTIKVRKKDIMPGEQKMFAKTIEHFLKERNT